MSSVFPLPRPRADDRAAGAMPARSNLDRRHAVLILLFALLIPATFALFGAAVGDKMRLEDLAVEILVFLGLGTASVATSRFADRTLRTRVDQGWRIAGAILAAAIAGMLWNELLNVAAAAVGHDIAAKLAAKGITSAGHRLLLEFAEAANWTLMLVILYELLESSRRATEELHAARMSALALQQKLVEGELRAMQARVDPALLFESLVAVDEAYAQAPGRGQQRLDALIRFLRAALPSEAAEMSTVAREQELIEAYFALAAEPGPAAARLRVSADRTASSESLPSMLLLPLVRWAMTFPSARRVEMRMDGHAEGLRIELEHDGHREEPRGADEIASLRTHLARLYREHARLNVHCEAGRWRVVLEIPRSRTPGA